MSGLLGLPVDRPVPVRVTVAPRLAAVGDSLEMVGVGGRGRERGDSYLENLGIIRKARQVLLGEREMPFIPLVKPTFAHKASQFRILETLAFVFKALT